MPQQPIIIYIQYNNGILPIEQFSATLHFDITNDILFLDTDVHLLQSLKISRSFDLEQYTMGYIKYMQIANRTESLNISRGVYRSQSFVMSPVCYSLRAIYLTHTCNNNIQELATIVKLLICNSIYCYRYCSPC